MNGRAILHFQTNSPLWEYCCRRPDVLRLTAYQLIKNNPLGRAFSTQCAIAMQFYLLYSYS